LIYILAADFSIYIPAADFRLTRRRRIFDLHAGPSESPAADYRHTRLRKIVESQSQTRGLIKQHVPTP
jgi:hypothetical protein